MDITITIESFADWQAKNPKVRDIVLEQGEYVVSMRGPAVAMSLPCNSYAHGIARIIECGWQTTADDRMSRKLYV